MELGAPLNRVHCFPASGLGGKEVGTLEASSIIFIILVPGESHFDLLLLKFTF